MTIEVLFFAQLREAFGTDRSVLDVSDGETVREAAGRLLDRHGDKRIAALPLSYAVNEEFVAGDYRLREGDRLALLAPVSGG